MKAIGLMAVAAMLAATPLSAAPSASFPGEWSGDCGSEINCSVSIQRSGGGGYAVLLVLEGRNGSGGPVCRRVGTFNVSQDGNLSGRGFGGRDVRISLEGGSAIRLAGAGTSHCGRQRAVNGTYRRVD